MLTKSEFIKKLKEARASQLLIDRRLNEIFDGNNFELVHFEAENSNNLGEAIQCYITYGDMPISNNLGDFWNCYKKIEKRRKNKMNTKINLEEKVQQWFVDRNLHEANPVKQFLKLMEESGELFEGIAKDKTELIYDALGDIQVVLIGLEQQIKNGAQISANQQELELLLMVSSLGNIAQKLYAHVCHNETQIPLIKTDLMFLDSVVSTVSFCNGTTAESCLEEAYEVIKNRKGKMIDGVFVKEEDL